MENISPEIGASATSVPYVAPAKQAFFLCSTGHCRENKPFSNSNQSLVSPMVTRLGPVGFSQRPDPVRTFAGELAEDTFKQAKT